MRIDLNTAEPGTVDETAAIEAQWTRAWRGRGQPAGPRRPHTRQGGIPGNRPYLARLRPGARLLDGGCGLGDWTLHFTRAGYPTLGLDISRATVDPLQLKFPEAEFVVGDIRSTGLPDASSGGYFSWGTFEHFQDGLGG